MRRYRPIVAGCILLAAEASASSLTLEESAQKLDPSIQSVSLCGQWTYGNERGVYRVISGWLWGHSELYVQWLAEPIWYPENGQQERRLPLVMKTATFPELNSYESATDLNNVRCAEHNGRWVITADAENSHETPSLKYELVIQLYHQPGKYHLSEGKPAEH